MIIRSNYLSTSTPPAYARHLVDLFDGRELHTLHEEELRELRWLMEEDTHVYIDGAPAGGFELDAALNAVEEVRYWYSRTFRSWAVVRFVDEDQLGEAEWVNSEREARARAQTLAAGRMAVRKLSPSL